MTLYDMSASRLRQSSDKVRHSNQILSLTFTMIDM